MEGQIDEQVRRRFEADWVAGRPQAIEHYLPSSEIAVSLQTLEELVLIELEFAWKSRPAEGPLVEHYVRRFPQLDEPAILSPGLLRLLRSLYREIAPPRVAMTMPWIAVSFMVLS